MCESMNIKHPPPPWKDRTRPYLRRLCLVLPQWVLAPTPAPTLFCPKNNHCPDFYINHFLAFLAPGLRPYFWVIKWNLTVH